MKTILRLIDFENQPTPVRLFAELDKLNGSDTSETPQYRKIAPYKLREPFPWLRVFSLCLFVLTVIAVSGTVGGMIVAARIAH